MPTIYHTGKLLHDWVRELLERSISLHGAVSAEAVSPFSLPPNPKLVNLFSSPLLKSYPCSYY